MRSIFMFECVRITARSEIRLVGKIVKNTAATMIESFANHLDIMKRIQSFTSLLCDAGVARIKLAVDQ